MKVLVCLLSVFSLCLSQGQWNIELSPETKATVPFGQTHISVWEHATTKGRFYALPLVCLLAETAEVMENVFTGRTELEFRVLLWSLEAREAVFRHLKSWVNASVTEEQVELLPMEKVRLVWKDRDRPLPDHFTLVDGWRANTLLPSTVLFHIVCDNHDLCQSLRYVMRTRPSQFSGLELEYVVNTQRSARRRVTVRGSHVVRGQLYSRMVRMPVQTGVRYLRDQDVSLLAAQTAAAVVSTVTTDEDYVDTQDELSMTELLKAAFRRHRVSTATFQPTSWEAVLWTDKHTRPDQICNYLNRILTTDNENNGEADFVLNQNQRSTSVEASLGLFGNVSSTTHSIQKDWILNGVHERNYHVQWNGVRFVPAPMQLVRLNLASVNASTDAVSHRVQVRRYEVVQAVPVRVDCGAGNQTGGLSPQLVQKRLEEKLTEQTSRLEAVINQKLETVIANYTNRVETAINRRLNTMANRTSKMETATNDNLRAIANKTTRLETAVNRKLNTIENRISRLNEQVLTVVNQTEELKGNMTDFAKKMAMSAEGVRLRDAMNTMSSAYCYIPKKQCPSPYPASSEFHNRATLSRLTTICMENPRCKSFNYYGPHTNGRVFEDCPNDLSDEHDLDRYYVKLSSTENSHDIVQAILRSSSGIVNDEICARAFGAGYKSDRT